MTAPPTIWDVLALAVVPAGYAAAQVYLRVADWATRRARMQAMICARVRAYRGGGEVTR